MLDNSNNRVIIDIQQIQKVKNHKWWLDSNGYVKAIINGETVSLHRFLTNAKTEYDIDHKDRNKLNNRMSNFRSATRSENCMNRGKQSNNKSGVVGVSWHKQHQKWYANITKNKKVIFLGLFDDLEDAKQKRIDAEQKYFGDFRSDVNDNTNAITG